MGTVEDFLDLTPEESAYIELKLKLAEGGDHHSMSDIGYQKGYDVRPVIERDFPMLFNLYISASGRIIYQY